MLGEAFGSCPQTCDSWVEGRLLVAGDRRGKGQQRRMGCGGGEQREGCE